MHLTRQPVHNFDVTRNACKARAMFLIFFIYCGKGTPFSLCCPKQISENLSLAFFFSLSPNISHILPLQNSLNNSWNGSLNTSLNTSGGKVKVSCIHYHQWTVFDRAYCEGFPPTLLLTLFFCSTERAFQEGASRGNRDQPKV